MTAGLAAAQTDTHFIHTRNAGTSRAPRRGSFVSGKEFDSKHVQSSIHSAALSGLRTQSVYAVYAHWDEHPVRRRSSSMLKTWITQHYDNI